MKLAVLLFCSILLSGLNVYGQDIKELTQKYQVAFFDGFKEKSLANYEFTNSANWVITKNGESGKDIKCAFGIGTQANDHFPLEIALIKDINLGDFIVEFDYLQKNRNFSIRDICILFGYQDSTHYYFAQASSDAGKYSHNVFKVDEDRPVAIGENLNEGVVWNYQKWHHIVLIRNTASSKVELYIDDELILKSNKSNGGEGRIGFGTFGSGFKVDNLKIWTPETSR